MRQTDYLHIYDDQSLVVDQTNTYANLRKSMRSNLTEDPRPPPCLTRHMYPVPERTDKTAQTKNNHAVSNVCFFYSHDLLCIYPSHPTRKGRKRHPSLIHTSRQACHPNTLGHTAGQYLNVQSLYYGQSYHHKALRERQTLSYMKRPCIQRHAASCCRGLPRNPRYFDQRAVSYQ